MTERFRSCLCKKNTRKFDCPICFFINNFKSNVGQNFKTCLIFFSSIYLVNKAFFMIQTVDRSKHYCPENKIFLDVPAALKIFDDKIGIVQHVKELTKELCDSWNDKYFDQPQASLTFTKNYDTHFFF